MFRFYNQGLLWLLFLIPLIILFYQVFARRQSKKMEKAFGPKLFPFLTSSVSKQKRKWKLLLKSASFLFFVIAWARPQMGEKSETVKNEGVEIIYAVDVSESMLAEDLKPNRLEQAKLQLSRLLELMPNNKIGVLAFAGSAALVSPLTQDIAALKMFLNSLSTSMISTQGTDFRRAMEVDEKAVEEGGVTKDDSHHVTRILLIVSDGEDHEPGAFDKVKELQKKGIFVFSLAFGTEKGGAIPIKDNSGYLKGYKKDRGGQTVMSVVKGETLNRLAQEGKGSFYFASFGEDYLKKIVSDIGRLEKATFSSTSVTQYGELYQFFLLMGVLLAFLDLLIGERRGDFQFWKGRFERPTS